MKRKKSTTKHQKSSDNKLLKGTVWFLIALLTGVIFIGIGYYLGYKDGIRYTDVKHPTSPQVATTSVKPPKPPKEFSAPVSEEEIKERLKTVLKEEQNKYAQEGASHEYEEPIEKLEHPPTAEIRPKPKPDQRPKLAIIIDDVSFTQDVQAIKALGMNVTMSFLPPNAIHPNSAKLAAKEPFYMVHLPMEAMHFNHAEPITLKVNDSQQIIMNRVAKIVSLFPRVQYINNHTGSKFTSNEVAMNRLVFALNKYHIHFIDSRTIAETTVPKVMKEYGQRYVARDVFLDHKMEVPYVKKQIAEAVRIAKEKGFAIAIGHPHKNTLEALEESKALLSQVQLVQINKI